MNFKPPLAAMKEGFVSLTKEDRVFGIVPTSGGQLSLIAQKTRGRHEHPTAIWGMVSARPVLRIACESRGPQLIVTDITMDDNHVDIRTLGDCMVAMARRWGNVLYENLDERVDEAYRALAEASQR